LKIAVNTRLLLKNKLEGIGWFTYESLRRMVRAHPEHEFYFLFDRPYDSRFVFAQNVHPIVVSPPTRHPVLQYWWFEHALPAALKEIQPDLFFSPDAYNSLSLPYKNIMVIHDLNFEHYPAFLPWADRLYYRHFTPLFAKKADRILTVSNFSKGDIHRQYGIGTDKIDVVYNGANSFYHPLSFDQIKQVRARISDGKSYFLFVGAFNPRKNITRLFQAFDLFKQKGRNHIKLVMVGEKMYWTSEMKRSYQQMVHRKDVVFTGRLEPNQLSDVMGAALGLVFVPLFEGFGIPVLEAFEAEIPVITSNVSSLPEVAGDAALLVDPFSIETIAEAMKSITFDPDLRRQLVEKGRVQKKRFSWDQTAKRVWQSIETVLVSI
jgi:glycosyltransferase involved in cell wall biosynthesis